jgi:predicted nucleic acid-binding protein
VAHYFDTSALAKLVVREPESAAVHAWLQAQARHPVAADLVRTELSRAVVRVAPDRLDRVRAVLLCVDLVAITPAILQEAGRLQPSWLRTLDAIHLATALALDDDLESIVTYDDRLAAAARFHGLPVTAPSGS